MTSYSIIYSNVTAGKARARALSICSCMVFHPIPVDAAGPKPHTMDMPHLVSCFGNFGS